MHRVCFLRWHQACRIHGTCVIKGEQTYLTCGAGSSTAFPGNGLPSSALQHVWFCAAGGSRLSLRDTWPWDVPDVHFARLHAALASSDAQLWERGGIRRERRPACSLQPTGGFFFPHRKQLCMECGQAYPSCSRSVWLPGLVCQLHRDFLHLWFAWQWSGYLCYMVSSPGEPTCSTRCNTSCMASCQRGSADSAPASASSSSER